MRRYTIQVANVGNADVAAGGVIIADTLDDHVSYVPDTLVYSSPDGTKSVADDSSGTKYPLDGDGITNQYVFKRRGGTHELSFEVIIDDAKDCMKKQIVNNGRVSFGNTNIPFTLTTPLNFKARVKIEKTVYKGHDNRASCNGGELETGPQGEPVTYCFEVTNTGDTYLKNVKVQDQTLNFLENSNGLLAPGATTTMAMEEAIEVDLEGDAEVTGEPAFKDGQQIPGLGPVTDKDPAGVKITYAASIQIEKTVYPGHDNKASCSGGEKVTGPQGQRVTYCFEVTNTGDTYLNNVKIKDPELGLQKSLNISLAPGETVIVGLEDTIQETVHSDAVVTGKPVDGKGDAIPGFGKVTDQDTAGVDLTVPEEENGGNSPRLGDYEEEEEWLCV